MTTMAQSPLSEQQHLVLDQMPWSFYEQVLAATVDRPLRVTFNDGSIEIMPPLPEHELPSEAIGSLIDVLTLELRIPVTRFGSTTFRREDRLKGLEPDKCYYLKNESRVRGMKTFDPAIYPPPDLAIEIDITSRSIPREPVYAGLGVAELWRYDGSTLTVLLLDADGTYGSNVSSLAFPFLQMKRFEAFVHRMENEEQTQVLWDFREWVRALPTR